MRFEVVKSDFMKIAIVRLSALGDIFQSMIILQFIKSKYPTAQIDWVVDSFYEDALKGNSDINNIITVNLKKLKKSFSFRELFNIIKRLKSLSTYDYIIDLQGLLKSAVISSFIPGKSRFGYDKRSIREKFAALFYSKTFSIPYDENVIKRYVGILNYALDLEITSKEIFSKKPIFNYPKNDNPTTKKGLIIIGASFESKIYPVEYFARVVNSLDLDFIVVWKTAKEKKMATELVKLTNKSNLSDGLDLSALKNLVANASIVIGGDTGPTHLAWAMNIPSITLFGPTPMERNFFQTSINHGIKSKSNVNPYKINKNDDSIRNINPAEISHLASKILKI